MKPGWFIRWHMVVLLASALAAGACSGDTATDAGTPCTRDDECGIGEYCNDGVCTPIGGDEGPLTCTFDADCPGDHICDDGICVPGTRPDGGVDAGTDATGDQAADGAADQPADEHVPEPQITLAGDVITHEDQQGKTYEINYGNVAVGVPVSRIMVIRNTGDADLEVTVVTIDDDPQNEFTLEPAVPPALRIEPGGEESLALNYDAQDGLTDRAVAKVFSSDPDEGEIHVQLISEFKGEARIHIDPVALDFGDLPLDQPETLPVVVSNQGTGNAVLSVHSVAPEAGIASAYRAMLVDPDSEQELTPPIHLNRGDLVRVDVTFLAPSRGTFEGNLVIESSDETASPSTVSLRGRADTPIITVDPLQVNFGQVPANTWADDQQVTITNHGVGALILSSIGLTPGSSADIGIEGLPDLPHTLLPDGSATVTVRYNPVDVGPDMATLVIVHDDPDHQPDVRVDIGGEGIQGNARPSAVIKADGQDTALVTVELGDRVDLDGGDSFDNDGTVIAWEWRIAEQPSVHPCGQPSTLSGTMNPQTFIVLREAGLTRIGLRVEDDLEAWSDEDILDIQVVAPPDAEIRVGGNDTGYIEVDMGDTLSFNGGFSTDCDGVVTDYQWTIEQYPPGRGAPPPIGGGDQYASVLFDFPGSYRVGLVVLDNDVPQNPSEMAVFDVLVKGPRAFRITVDWFDRGHEDHKVDVDLHLLKPGSTDLCSLDDCYPPKPGGNHPDCDDNGNANPDWGVLGSPVYQRDGWEDGDAAEPPNPANPADEINFPSPGMGAYGIYVTFRCHSSTQMGGDYMCCDDFCSVGCPFCVPCGAGMEDNRCLRRAVGEVRIYVTGFDNQESELTSARRQFAFDDEEQYQFRQIGSLSWPEGTFQ